MSKAKPKNVKQLDSPSNKVREAMDGAEELIQKALEIGEEKQLSANDLVVMGVEYCRITLHMAAISQNMTEEEREIYKSAWRDTFSQVIEKDGEFKELEKAWRQPRH